VSIELVGTAKGLDLGGVILVRSSTVTVEGLPLDVPDAVKVDVTALNIGDSVKFSDISLPEKLKMISDASALCVEVVTRSAEIEEEEEAGEAAVTE